MKKIRFSLALSIGIFLVFSTAFAQIGVGVSISANIAPPELPVYTQPPCPADGYLWTPGYWAYDNVDGYYWVPGVWVLPPQAGFLWTPCYWGFDGGVYGWHAGYWGAHVGFYGGVNYGYGYSGFGFGGGRWEGNSFRYNRAVMNVNITTVHNTYIDRSVIRGNMNNRISFNGGPRGIRARPNAQEQSAMRERHVGPTSQQASHQQVAGRDRNQFAKVNHGRPATTAMNTVGGRHFNQQGHVANAAVSPVRPQAGGHTTPGNHPTQQHAVTSQQRSQAQQHAAPQQRSQAAQQHAASQQRSQTQQHAASQQRSQAQQHAAPQQRPQQQQQRPQQQRPQQQQQRPQQQRPQQQQQRPQQQRPQQQHARG